MNLSTCTPDQNESIQCVNRPLLISAGAGSGKTFTLTQRIAYALLPESGPVASDIDEILAITFTEKAASEIKARVKRTLRQEGLNQEALKVDGAWISTIHGMCSRILRAHALEAELDPEFSLLSEAEAQEMRDDAINELISSQDNRAAGVYADLFAEYGTKSFSFNSTSVMELLQELLSQAASLKSGLEAIQLGPEPLKPSELVKRYMLNCEALEGVLSGAKQTKTVAAACANMEQSIGACQFFLQEHPELSRGAASQVDLHAIRAEYLKVATLFEGLPWISLAGAGSAKEHFETWQAEITFLYNELQLGLARPYMEQLISLARQTKALLDAKKRQIGKLDNDDLLLKTQELFERYPAIAQRYENRFKLVMIDEFQDTSQLQVDMVSRMSGENCAHLCTVGDSQQSIYRFRGADVQVYENHKATMRSSEIDAKYIELKKNFRSHQDVLSFVDCIFSQPRSFGKSFMSLEPHLERPTRYVSEDPRISLVMVTREDKRGSIYKSVDARAEKARLIACQLRKLQEAGHRAGDMVLLLGKMTYAHMYAQALRDAGFECIITGGSLFASAPEVCVVKRLAQVLVNPLDGEALFEVLTSDMINLSVDELLSIASRFDDETQQMRKQRLAKGFARLVRAEESHDGALGLAISLFRQAEDEMPMLSFSRVITHVIVRSGWLWRLEQQGATGKAQSANILKALRLIESIEQDKQGGPAFLAAEFAAELSSAKEAPGSLSGSGDDVVKIMTIHASKGLEFPIVALAEFEAKSLAAGKLACLPGENGLYLSLASAKTLDAFPTLAKNLKNGKEKYLVESSNMLSEAHEIDTPQKCLTYAHDASQYLNLLQRVASVQDVAEARRKLYVGLTRASEALVVAFDATWKAKDGTYNADVLVDDIRLALTEATDVFFDKDTYEYGGTQPAQVIRTVLSEQEQSCEGEASCKEPSSESIPEDDQLDKKQPDSDLTVEQPDEFVVPALPLGFARRMRTPYERGPVFSYSSIADHAHGECIGDAHEMTDEDQAPIKRDDLPEELQSVRDRESVLSDCSGTLDAHTLATFFGSAFHRCAQYAMETGRIPDGARREIIAQGYGLSDVGYERLCRACDLYFKSAVFKQTLEFENHQAEVPFYVRVGEAYMEGEIDALCFHNAAKTAFVVDYKTGGSPKEDAAQLHQKHLLQASCYAYALLDGGFDTVLLNFVRVEQSDAEGMPQVVSYEFSNQDKEGLAQHIEKQWKQANAQTT